MNARKIMLMIGIMAAHAFGEGAGVGVSFCGNRGWAQVRRTRHFACQPAESAQADVMGHFADAVVSHSARWVL